MYTYQADVWCDECGESIRAQLLPEGRAPEDPADEYFYDSDDLPKGPYNEDEETDTPQHCASGEDCLNAIGLTSGRKIGALLSTRLTDEGIELVRLALHLRSEIAEVWAEAFDVYLEEEATGERTA